jgi:hypothetical protein
MAWQISLGKALGRAVRPFADDAVRGLGGYGNSIYRNAGVGGMLGGVGSLFDSAIHQDFDASEFGKEIGQGALIGGALGGIGGGGMSFVGSKVPKLSMLKNGGRLAKGMGGLGALGAGVDYKLPGSEGSEVMPGPELGSIGGRPVQGPVLDPFSGVPNAPTMTLADYMENKRLNGIADSQIALKLNPLSRQVSSIRKDMNTDLASNNTIGQDLQNQMAQIARDNKNASVAIQGAASNEAERTADQVDRAVEEVGSSLAGDNASREEYAQQNAANEKMLAERRMADSELLKRLGVSGQEILSELQAAEVQQTGQNAVKIRTDARDAIIETRGQMNDVRGQRPGILYSLASGAFDSSIQKHQASLDAFKTKLAAAQSRAEAQSMAMDSMGPSMKPDQMYGDSGSTIMNPTSGHADQVPIFATWPREYALSQGIPAETYDTWMNMIAESRK